MLKKGRTSTYTNNPRGTNRQWGKRSWNKTQCNQRGVAKKGWENADATLLKIRLGKKKTSVS